MNIILRPLSLADVTDHYIAWMNDPEVTRDLVAGNRPQTRETVEAFVRSLVWPQAVAFRVVAGGGHIGNVMLRQIDWVNRTAEVGILIGNKGYWRQGVGKEALRLIAEYARTLQFHRLWAGTCGEPARQLFLSAGWTEEGCQNQHVLIRGEYRDHYLFGLMLDMGRSLALRAECLTPQSALPHSELKQCKVD